MKTRAILGVLATLCIAAQAIGQTSRPIVPRPPATVPVDVTLYLEASFTRAWGGNANTTATRMFESAAQFYKSNYGMELRLARIDAPPVNTETGDNRIPTASGSILNLMRTGFPATTFNNGRATSNWLLVHRESAGSQGQVDSIGALGKTRYANLYINTLQARVAGQDFGFPQSPDFYSCATVPARARTAAEMSITALHEFGHLMSANHINNCRNSAMCNLPAPTCQRVAGSEGRFVFTATQDARMDSTADSRIKAHRDCYLRDDIARLQCGFNGVP